MVKGEKLVKNLLLPVVLSLVLLAIVIFPFKWGWFDTLESMSYDLRFKVRGALPPTDRIIIVAKDEESKQYLKKRGVDFTRSYYAAVIENLTRWGARVIALDFEFSLPVYQDEVQDENFARALDESGRVVLARFIQNGKPVPPFPPFRDLEMGEGFINFTLDRDGVLRRLPLLELEIEKNNIIPYFAFALETYVDYLYPDTAPTVELSMEGNSIPPGYFKVGDLMLPDHIYINFVGPPDTFRMVSFWRVLRGKVDPAIFKDKMVLVGSTLPADHDFYKVPFSGRGENEKLSGGGELVVEGSGLMSGVEVHANVIQTIMKGNWIRRWVAPDGTRTMENYYLLGGVILLGALLFILLPLGVVPALILFVLGLVAYVGLSYYLFVKDNFWLETVAPLTGWVLSFGVGVFYHRYVEAREKKFIKDTFGRYVSPQIVRQLLSRPELVKLGGSKVNVTVLFSDIRGFTTLSEGMDPQELVNFLNEYLSEMTRIIFKYNGVVDKYIGDAIMAFWGAPIHDEQHPVNACRSAVEMIRRLRELNKKWQAEGKPEIRIGIGINSGEVTVGNMGSDVRFDYTVMGDNVNLASRLEGINKQYGTSIIISEYTYEKVRNEFVTRKLDKVAVKGKKKPVEIYELIGRRGEVGVDAIKWIKLFEKGLQLYFDKDFAEARKYFAGALKLNGNDHAARVFIERCDSLIKNPPPPDWDGVFIMKTK